MKPIIIKISNCKTEIARVQPKHTTEAVIVDGRKIDNECETKKVKHIELEFIESISRIKKIPRRNIKRPFYRQYDKW